MEILVCLSKVTLFFLFMEEFFYYFFLHFYIQIQIDTHERAKEGKTSKFNNLSVMTDEPFISILRPVHHHTNNTTFVNGLCRPPLHDTGSQYWYLVLFNRVCVNNVIHKKPNCLYVYSAPHPIFCHVHTCLKLLDVHHMSTLS